jgi:hypothetical protein
VQLGSFFEMYHLEDGYFHELRELAEVNSTYQKLLHSASRIGRFLTGNPYWKSDGGLL